MLGKDDKSCLIWIQDTAILTKLSGKRSSDPLHEHLVFFSFNSRVFRKKMIEKSRKQWSWQDSESGYYGSIAVLAQVEGAFSTSGYLRRSKSQSWNTLLLMAWINTHQAGHISIKCIGLYKLITSTCIASSHIIVQLLVLSIITLSTLHRNKTEDFTLWKILSFACGNDSFHTMDLLHHRTTERAPGLQQFRALFWWNDCHTIKSQLF